MYVNYEVGYAVLLRPADMTLAVIASINTYLAISWPSPPFLIISLKPARLKFSWSRNLMTSSLSAEPALSLILKTPTNVVIPKT